MIYPVYYKKSAEDMQKFKPKYYLYMRKFVCFLYFRKIGSQKKNKVKQVLYGGFECVHYCIMIL